MCICAISALPEVFVYCFTSFPFGSAVEGKREGVSVLYSVWRGKTSLESDLWVGGGGGNSGSSEVTLNRPVNKHTHTCTAVACMFLKALYTSALSSCGRPLSPVSLLKSHSSSLTVVLWARLPGVWYSVLSATCLHHAPSSFSSSCALWMCVSLIMEDCSCTKRVSKPRKES